MTTTEAKAALWKSVEKFGEVMCQMKHGDALSDSIHDIDDKITALIEAAKSQQAQDMLAIVASTKARCGHV